MRPTNTVWVLEEANQKARLCRNIWCPLDYASPSKAAATEELRLARLDEPTKTFRICKYVRAE